SVALAVGAAETVGDALTAMLERVCEAMDWSVGEVWVPDSDGSALELASVRPRDESASGFTRSSTSHRFHRGEGCIGRGWEAGDVLWWSAATDGASFLRASQAAEAGLRVGIGLPIRAGTEIVGVLAFYREDIRLEDERRASALERLAR